MTQQNYDRNDEPFDEVKCLSCDQQTTMRVGDKPFCVDCVMAGRAQAYLKALNTQKEMEF